MTKQEYDLSYTDLYGKNSELGRWLRSKNVIQIIGDKIFVHGGISSELLASKLTLEQITEIALGAVEKPKDNYSEHEKLVMGPSGPLWFRGYLREVKDGLPFTEQVLEETLERNRAKYVIVGHTVVKKPKRIFNGRIIAVDVIPPKDHQIRIPLLTAYGVFIQNDEFTLADDNGFLEKMDIQK